MENSTRAANYHQYSVALSPVTSLRPLGPVAILRIESAVLIATRKHPIAPRLCTHISEKVLEAMPTRRNDIWATRTSCVCPRRVGRRGFVTPRM
jgi:hypothetical protein